MGMFYFYFFSFLYFLYFHFILFYFILCSFLLSFLFRWFFVLVRVKQVVRFYKVFIIKSRGRGVYTMGIVITKKNE